MSRKVITVLVAVAVMFLVGTHLVSDTNAGETVAVPAPVAVAGCSGSVQTGCAGSNQPALLVARWTPVRNLFTRAKMRRAARSGCGGYSVPAPNGCSAPQVTPVQACVSVQMAQPVQVISVAPIRLFRSCANGQCR